METNIRKFTETLPVTLLVIATAIWFLLWLRRRKKLNLPPGPKGYPIVGCLPMLGEEPHLTLHKWVHKYGDVYGLYLGGSYVVVISDPITSKEIFNETSNLLRPPNFFHFMPDGVGMADLNGLEWSEQRRYTMRQMKNFGLGRSVWNDLLQEEAQNFLKYLEDSEGKPVNYALYLSSSFSNNILSFVTGKPLAPSDPGRDILHKGTESFEIVHVQSGKQTLFPKLFKMATYLGLTSIVSHVRNISNMNKFVRKEVEICKREKSDQPTFLTEYVKEMKNENKGKNNYFNEKNLIGNIQALILAGTDTTHLSLSWLLLAMATHPDEQKKVHQELDSVLGHSDEPISYVVDRKRFPYCCATMDEAQRWRTVAPLNLYHSCSTDIKIKNYDVPAGSYLLAFLWAFHNDPKHWPEPERFKPERFLNESGNSKKDGFAPFSLGKRKCPGELVAYMEIFVYFTSIMRKFEVFLPEQDTKFDMEGILALTLRPKPHKLKFVLRDKTK